MDNNSPELAKHLEAIINCAIDGIITIDQNGIIEMINPAAAQLFQYQAEEVIGKTINNLMPEPYRSSHDHYLKRYLETKKAAIIGIGREVTGLKKDGTKFPFRLAVSEVILNDRIIFTGIIHDLSDLRKAERKLMEINNTLEEKIEERTIELEKVINKLLLTNRELEKREHELHSALSKEKELSDLKSRFVSTASHEFRTPLSTILSSVSILSQYHKTEQQDKRLKHVERIKSAVSNLTGILNDFLSLSKLEEGYIQVNPEHFSLNTLCTTVKGDLLGMLKSGQKITTQMNGNYQIYSDSKIIKNIMFNLISNAIKYSGENSIIHCNIEKENHNFIFMVNDEGIGIPKEDQKHLFSRFFRASNVEGTQGTGLGLNIVRRYLELIGGSIRYESSRGAGTTFWVSLPNMKA